VPELLTLELSPSAESVRPARIAVREQLAALGLEASAPVAVLATSELVSNAVRLRPGSIRLDLRAGRDAIRIEVSAEGVRYATMDPPPRDHAEELSLAVVAAFARQLGLQRSRDGSDVMWLELDALE
jgi:anti-sigma regulatory factor (Ser/Thr protein kinase)